MFRNRNAQKPPAELLASFRQKFPEVSSTGAEAPAHRPASLGHASSADGPSHLAARFELDADHLKDHDATPRGNTETWRLTPSLLDPESFAFTSFANQPPGYYTPTPGGANTLYHSQAGDLHTPAMAMGAVTPLSHPTTQAVIPSGPTIDLPAPSDPLHAPQFGNFNPFAPQQSFAPSQFQHHHPFEVMDATAGESPTVDALAFDPLPPPTSSAAAPASATATAPVTGQLSDRFRFGVTLHAPTAMVKQADEIPVTYLNKGQAYSISMVDTAPVALAGPVKYRTFIRVSFEDEVQRQRPGACWQLWKEGRGSNEAHQRGGRLQAVECVEPAATKNSDDNGNPVVELESASFDGFAVSWTVAAGASPECAVVVRFNFLSTDFSHSKGVKGIPVRLCAKTEIMSAGPEPASELCYCKVKLFRDHGAERKLSNDIAHVKKTIDKLKQQIAQAESGLKDFRKKKQRSGSSSVKNASAAGPGKAHKHKRTWSMGSASSSGDRSSVEDDLHAKLATMQDMFTSTRPASVLFLHGDPEDDPDFHPVHLAGEPLDLTRMEISSDGRRPSSAQHSTESSSMVSPASSSSGFGNMYSSGDLQATSQMTAEAGGQGSTGQADLQSNPQHLASPPDQTVKIARPSSTEGGASQSWIDAMDVDSSYRPRPTQQVQPVACVYVRPKGNGPVCGDQYYRAVYLMQRKAEELVRSVACKCHIESSRVARAVHVNSKGLTIMMDDDVVQQLPEGQDMLLDLVEVTGEKSTKAEANSTATIQEDEDLDMTSSSNIEMRFIY